MQAHSSTDSEPPQAVGTDPYTRQRMSDGVYIIYAGAQPIGRIERLTPHIWIVPTILKIRTRQPQSFGSATEAANALYTRWVHDTVVIDPFLAMVRQWRDIPRGPVTTSDDLDRSPRLRAKWEMYCQQLAQRMYPDAFLHAPPRIQWQPLRDLHDHRPTFAKYVSQQCVAHEWLAREANVTVEAIIAIEYCRLVPDQRMQDRLARVLDLDKATALRWPEYPTHGGTP